MVLTVDLTHMSIAFVSLLARMLAYVVTICVAIFKKSWKLTLKKDRDSSSPTVCRDRQVLRPAPALDGISFKDVLEGKALPIAMNTLAKRQIECAFGFDVVNATIQAISFENGNLKIVYEFSKRGNELLSSHQAIIPVTENGHKLLPMLKDANSGKVLEFAKGSTDFVGRAAQISSIVTSVAHVISSVDIVNRLKEIDRKLNILVAGRKNDQLADLEATYGQIREAFSRTDWFEDRAELKECRNRLRRLRLVWRRDLESVLDDSPTTLDSLGFERFGGEWRAANPLLFAAQKITGVIRESGEKKLSSHLSPLVPLIANLRVSLMLEILLVQAFEDSDAFRSWASNEHAMWKGIDEKLVATHSRIRTYGDPDEYKLIQRAVTGYMSFLNSLAI